MVKAIDNKVQQMGYRMIQLEEKDNEYEQRLMSAMHSQKAKSSGGKRTKGTKSRRYQSPFKNTYIMSRF